MYSNSGPSLHLVTDIEQCHGGYGVVWLYSRLWYSAVEECIHHYKAYKKRQIRRNYTSYTHILLLNAVCCTNSWTHVTKCLIHNSKKCWHSLNVANPDSPVLLVAHRGGLVKLTTRQCARREKEEVYFVNKTPAQLLKYHSSLKSVIFKTCLHANPVKISVSKIRLIAGRTSLLLQFNCNISGKL